MKIFDSTNCILGEGPLWVHDRLFWVDIKDYSILCKENAQTAATRWKFDSRPTALGKVQNDSNLIIVAFEDGVYFFDILSGKRSLLKRYEIPSTDRSNDGSVAPDGSFWIGTMDDDEKEKSGCLLRFGGESFDILLRDIGISNTIVWSPDNRYFYFADSMEQTIWKFEMDNNGSISNQTEFVSLKGSHFYPDGSAIDAQGYVWNAQWGGSRVVRYSPKGAIDTIISLPVSQPTCCAFGGLECDTLFVTSASIGVEEELAGNTFILQGVPRGFPENSFVYDQKEGILS